MNHLTLAAVVLGLALLLTGADGAGPGVGKYQDLDRATADGYGMPSPCVPGMGDHFVKGSLLDETGSSSEPEVLGFAHGDEGPYSSPPSTSRPPT